MINLLDIIIVIFTCSLSGFVMRILEHGGYIDKIIAFFEKDDKQ